MSLVVTAGQRGDSPQFEAVLGRVRVPRPGPGRPRTRPRRVCGDKAYASRKNRAYLRRRGIRFTIPDKTDRARNRKKRGSRGGRFSLDEEGVQGGVPVGLDHLHRVHDIPSCVASMSARSGGHVRPCPAASRASWDGRRNSGSKPAACHCS